MHSDPMLLHDSVGTRQHIRRNRQADLFRCFEIDDEFKLRCLLYRQISGFSTLQNLIYIMGSTAVQISGVRSIEHELTLNEKILSVGK